MTQVRIHDTPLHISAAGAEDGSRLVPTNTVLAVVRGMSLAKEFRVAITKREVAFNQDLKAFACNPDVDPEFLFYALFARRDHIRELATEASHGTKKLDTEVLAAVELPCPSLEVQRRAVEVASAYDDLIENNRRRMALLEDAARQLYQEWFVRLRFPGHEHTRITKGVPEGWQKSSLGEHYNTASGGTPSRKVSEFFAGTIPWVKTGELVGGFVIDTEEKITEDAIQKSSAKFFPDRTVVVALYGATVGALGILAMPATTNQACCAVIPKGQNATYTYAYLTLAHNRSRLVALSAGAAQNNISQQIVREYPILIPPQPLMGSFHEFVALMFDQSLNLQTQNQKLRAARDLLLPRLMSGEIAV
jgi:type I restriction enzyme S subunit